MDTTKQTEKKQNPYERANILSSLTFSYMLPIFLRNLKRDITENDLFRPLDEHRSHILGDKLEKIWKEQHRKHKHSALYRALLRLFGLPFIMLGVLRLIDEVMLVVVMPLAIGRLVSYFEKDEHEQVISEYEAYTTGGIVVLARFTDALMTHKSMVGLQHTTMKMRVACGSLIYRKILRLDQSALAHTTIGQLVNLLSNDVSKFDQSLVLANYLFIAPIQTAVGTYLLYNEIGVSAFFGVALLLTIIPIQIWIGKKNSIYRLRTALRTDERVRLMNEIILGMQVIKMYCWEKPFSQLISLVRKKELKFIRNRAFFLGAMYSLEMFITRVSIFVSLLAYVLLLRHHITAEKVFAITAIYSVLRPVITTIFSLSITGISEVHISVQRIQKFLQLDEREPEESALMNGSHNSTASSKPKILLESVSAKWLKESCESTLEDINLTIESNQVVAVIGPVGSGKTSLFNVLLKELSLQGGTMEINGSISYASQEPWLFSASVRQNILFGTEFNEERYERVVDVCALKSDFELFPHGDKTLVGEKGKALSGGQKARINLARCIYKDSDIYLLDDPLSAVDANVGKHLYEKCIRDFLSEKICILITHQLQYLSSADKIIVMEDGKIEMAGNYSELQTSGLDFAQLLQKFHNAEEEVAEKERQRTRSIQSSDSLEECSDEEEPQVEKEHMESGNVKASLYFAYLRAGGGMANAICMLIIFCGAQVLSSAADYYVAYWSKMEEDFVLGQTANFSWVAYNNESLRDDENLVLYTYSGIILATIIFGVVHGFYFMLFLVIASSTLHNMSFSRIMKATMRFYNSNPSGRILNRFSRDLGNIDEYIPGVLYDIISIMLDLVGAVVLSAVVATWLLLPSVVLIVIFYFFRLFYIGTSRGVKRIEGITRSPIYSHMSASMQGLSTIRAFSAQEVLQKEFDAYQDNHSSAWFVFITSNRCFGFWLDTSCAIFVASAIFFLLYFKKGFYGGDMGLVITQYIGLTGALQWGMRQWSELENQMVSTERLLEYSKVEIEPERDKSDKKPKDWPERGTIEFRNVSLKYVETEPPVLRDLNFNINSQEKIGIVGRTGAGKSSIITALFQLYPIEGSIIVDDLDTTRLPLDDIRSRISIIPQEPVLFSGSMRKNLDPFDEYSDEALWNALDQVELKEDISELPAGLHSNVSEGGTNFSVGQRQLVCLARALIRNNSILVMDEATANVDPHTDSLIQNTIREKFANCTVLTIAHRLHTVMDSDRILVMNAGRVEEFDHPHNLLQNKHGFLYKLVETTGKTLTSNFENIARESFERKKYK